MVCNMQAMYDTSSVFCRASATYQHLKISYDINKTFWKKINPNFGGMVIFYYECDLFNMLNRIDFGLRLQDHPEQTNHHGPDQ